MCTNATEFRIIIEALQEQVEYLEEKCRVLEAERNIFYNFYIDYFKDLGEEPDEE